MKRFLWSSLFFLFLVCFTGCSARIGDFTLMSTKNVELGAKYEKVATASAKDEIIVFFIPLGEPNIENLVDKVLDQNKGDLLTNIVLTSYNYSFFFGIMGYEIKGDVWRRVSLTQFDPSGEYYELSRNGTGLVLISIKDPAKIYNARSR